MPTSVLSLKGLGLVGFGFLDFPEAPAFVESKPSFRFLAAGWAFYTHQSYYGSGQYQCIHRNNLT